VGKYSDVTYDAEHGFAHVQYKPGVLESAADVRAFASEIDREMAKLGKKVDIIIDLGELVVRPNVVRAYDEERQKLFAAYALRAYRYHGSGLVRTRILTSSTIHGQAANVFATFEDARAALLADRRKR
jgi:hypothetical protein